jgi:Protein of unknown function (DUF2818)
MNHGLEVWATIAVALIAANLPFVNERLFVFGPKQCPKALGWRLLELLLLAGLALGFGLAVENWIGQRQSQNWEFYAAGLCLFLTFAFPGFVWRYLRRGGRAAGATADV